jgi:hypothetical protein
LIGQTVLNKDLTVIKIAAIWKKCKKVAPYCILESGNMQIEYQ